MPASPLDRNAWFERPHFGARQVANQVGQLFGPRKIQWTEQRLVDGAEDGGICADADSQREYRSRGETEQDFFVGAREDLLRRVDGAWKIARSCPSVSPGRGCRAETT